MGWIHHSRTQERLALDELKQAFTLSDAPQVLGDNVTVLQFLQDAFHVLHDKRNVLLPEHAVGQRDLASFDVASREGGNPIVCTGAFGCDQKLCHIAFRYKSGMPTPVPESSLLINIAAAAGLERAEELGLVAKGQFFFEEGTRPDGKGQIVKYTAFFDRKDLPALQNIVKKLLTAVDEKLVSNVESMVR